MNDPSQLLSLFLNGALGRSGRKGARRAARFVTGNKGLITASGILAAAGVAWGIFDSLKQTPTGVVPVPAGSGSVPPLPLGARGVVGAGPTPDPEGVPIEVLRIVRLAVSAARADGTLAPQEQALILEHARKAGVEAAAAHELDRPHPLADIVRGVTDVQARHDLYTLAFAIVRADETVTGGERIYLAQLAHHLGLDPATAARLEAVAATEIDRPAPGS